MDEISYGCKDCRQLNFKAEEVYYLASGEFMCLSCYKRDKRIREQYNLEPLKLGITRENHINKRGN